VVRWTPLSRQNLDIFKVEKYFLALGESTRISARCLYLCIAGTESGTRVPGVGVVRYKI
jgi:hypothetical protein